MVCYSKLGSIAVVAVLTLACDGAPTTKLEWPHVKGPEHGRRPNTFAGYAHWDCAANDSTALMIYITDPDADMFPLPANDAHFRIELRLTTPHTEFGWSERTLFWPGDERIGVARRCGVAAGCVPVRGRITFATVKSNEAVAGDFELGTGTGNNVIGGIFKTGWVPQHNRSCFGF